MRRLLTTVVALALLAASCASDAQTEVTAVDVSQDAAEVAPATTEAVAQTEPADAPVEASSTTTTTEEPQAEPLPTGREAILANHSAGRPYVLFYWGAH